MAELPLEFRKTLNRMGRLIDGVPPLYAALWKIFGEDGPDTGEDLPPVAVEPKLQSPIVPAAGAAPMVVAESSVRPSLALSLSQLLRNAFDKKGAMTLSDLFAYLEKTGVMAKIIEVYGKKARSKVKFAAYDLKKQGLLIRADGKAATPYVPTPEFHVRQNHARKIANEHVDEAKAESTSQMLENAPDMSTQSPALSSEVA